MPKEYLQTAIWVRWVDTSLQPYPQDYTFEAGRQYFLQSCWIGEDGQKRVDLDTHMYRGSSSEAIFRDPALIFGVPSSAGSCDGGDDDGEGEGKIGEGKNRDDGGDAGKKENDAGTSTMSKPAIKSSARAVHFDLGKQTAAGSGNKALSESLSKPASSNSLVQNVSNTAQAPEAAAAIETTDPTNTLVYHAYQPTPYVYAPVVCTSTSCMAYACIRTCQCPRYVCAPSQGYTIYGLGNPVTYVPGMGSITWQSGE